MAAFTKTGEGHEMDLTRSHPSQVNMSHKCLWGLSVKMDDSIEDDATTLCKEAVCQPTLLLPAMEKTETGDVARRNFFYPLSSSSITFLSLPSTLPWAQEKTWFSPLHFYPHNDPEREMRLSLQLSQDSLPVNFVAELAFEPASVQS